MFVYSWYTVCQSSSDPFYILIFFKKWVTASWTWMCLCLKKCLNVANIESFGISSYTVCILFPASKISAIYPWLVNTGVIHLGLRTRPNHASVSAILSQKLQCKAHLGSRCFNQMPRRSLKCMQSINEEHIGAQS